MVEELIIRYLTIRVEGSAYAVEKVGDSDIKSRVALPDTFVNDSRRQVGLTAAAGPTQYKPALRFGGEGLGGLEGPGKPLLTAWIAASTFGHEIIEGEAG